MSRKHNNRGRQTSDGHFFQMFEWFMKTAAWQHATVYERALYLELKRRYNAKNNGDIGLSHREAQALLQCSNTPVDNAFKGLIEKGFIKAQQKGSFSWKVAREGKSYGRSTRWLLTELPQDLPERVLSGGTKEFLKWRPLEKPREKSAVRPHRTNGPTTSDHSENMARPHRTINPGVSDHVGR